MIENMDVFPEEAQSPQYVETTSTSVTVSAMNGTIVNSEMMDTVFRMDVVEYFLFEVTSPIDGR